MSNVFEGKQGNIANGIVEYINQKGRVGLSELVADVLPRVTINENEFVTLLGDMCKANKIMVACVDQGGPRYQVFSFAFTPVNVDHSRYLKPEYLLE